jgi:hypothetical protein
MFSITVIWLSSATHAFLDYNLMDFTTILCNICNYCMWFYWFTVVDSCSSVLCSYSDKPLYSYKHMQEVSTTLLMMFMDISCDMSEVSVMNNSDCTVVLIAYKPTNAYTVFCREGHIGHIITICQRDCCSVICRILCTIIQNHCWMNWTGLILALQLGSWIQQSHCLLR